MESPESPEFNSRNQTKLHVYASTLFCSYPFFFSFRVYSLARLLNLVSFGFWCRIWSWNCASVVMRIRVSVEWWILIGPSNDRPVLWLSHRLTSHFMIATPTSPSTSPTVFLVPWFLFLDSTGLPFSLYESESWSRLPFFRVSVSSFQELGDEWRTWARLLFSWMTMCHEEGWRAGVEAGEERIGESDEERGDVGPESMYVCMKASTTYERLDTSGTSSGSYRYNMYARTGCPTS